MKSIATIKLKIPENKLILKTMKQYSKAVSYIADKGFKVKIYNRYKLHHLCYYKAKDKFKLPSQFIINANRVASQTLKSIKTNKSSKPVFKEYLPLSFDRRTFSFSFNKVRLTTINGRIDIPIEIPEYYWRYLDWSYQTAQIIRTKQGLFIHVTFSRQVKSTSCSNGKVVGIDLGINNIAVTSNKQFFKGKKPFIKRWINVDSKLQSKGTKSAKILLKKRSGRWRRFMQWTNHNISKSIVDKLEVGDTIVMENIQNIRSKTRYNKWVHRWSFRQLQSFITYKAVSKGIRVVYANPFRTSKTCSRCGSTNTSRNSGFFHCLNCSYHLNSDLNASSNLTKLYMRNFGLVDITQPTSQVMIPKHL